MQKKSNGYDKAIELMMPILEKKGIVIPKEDAQNLVTVFCRKLVDHALLGNKFVCGRIRTFGVYVMKRPGYHYETKRKRGIRAIVDSEPGTELVLQGLGTLINKRREVIFEREYLIKLQLLSKNEDYIKLAL